MPQNNDFFIAPDQKARDAAVTETSNNVIVEAGAGTGKTTLLTDRLCYLILNKGIAIDKIIALTFTEKAAAEIKARLLDKMNDMLLLIKGEPPKQGEEEKRKETLKLRNKIARDDKSLKEHIEKNLELAERAIISTIHGFCFKILKRFPAEAGTAPDLTADAQNSSEAILDKVWTAFLDQQLNYDSPRADLWEDILSACTLQEIKSFAFTLLKQPLNNYHPDLKSREKAKILREKAQRAENFLKEYKNTSKKGNAFDRNLEQAIAVLNNTAAYHEGGEYGDVNMDQTKKVSRRPSGWTSEEDFLEAGEIIALANNASVKNIEILKKAHLVLSEFLPLAREALKKSNLIDFDDMILKTRDLVKTHLHVRQILKEEYQSILLDEFQDTDPEQGEIFLYLSETQDSQAKDWRDVLLERGKLFIVGDPKQSIYRFRGADISAYDVFIDTLLKQGAAKYFLQSNFRSSREIVAYANKFGQKAIEEEHGIQPKYVPIEHTKNYKAEPVRILAITDNGQKIHSERQRRFQADLIVKWINENAFKTELSEGRAMTYKDIAVLYRSATGLSLLIDALKQAAIPYSVEENKNFYQTQEIKDILNLLKLAQNPMDKTALIGVLRSPLCLIGDDEILALAESGSLNIYAEVSSPHIKACFDMLKEICRRAQTSPLEDFINYILYQTRFKQMQLLCGAGEQTSANISKFMDIARGFASNGMLALPQLIRHIEVYFKKKEKEGESPLAEDSLDSVKLMSIHKSKGLQFPVVLIYDIAKEDKKGNKEERSYLSDWLSGAGAPRLGKIKDLTYSLLEQTNKKHAKAEERRILYVALTRAKERLIILGSAKAAKTLAEPLLEAGCYPGEDMPPILQEGVCEVSYIPYGEGGAGAPGFGVHPGEGDPAFLTEWKEIWLKRSEEYKKAALRTPRPSAAAQSGYESEERTKAMLIGRICHRLLCQILLGREISLNNAAVIEGADPKADAEAIKEAQDIIEDFKQSEAFKKLTSMKTLACELPFSLKEGSAEVYGSGIIDAIFEDKFGGIFIAEFKSDKINKERQKETAGKYMPQLEAYLNAARVIFKGRKVNGALIFLRSKQICPLGED